MGIEPFQQRAWDALTGPARYVLLYGGSRSGKSHTTMQWMMIRAMAKPGSSHAVFRHRFNATRSTLIDGPTATLPKVCKTHWPGQKLYELNRTEWCAELRNGSRIYFGGLDDKDRTEKILGNEYCDIYLNECSQISYASMRIAATRINQDVGLRNKVVCDCNPPSRGHWTERSFLGHIDPVSKAALLRPEQYVAVQMNPAASPHLGQDYKDDLSSNTGRMRERFWLGEFGSASANALWTVDSIAAARIQRLPPGVTLRRVILSIDPSGCRGPEDERSDEVGMMVEGLGDDGVVYLLEDCSGRFGPNGPEGWGARAIERSLHWGVDCIYGESNFGGAMVGAVILTAEYKSPDGVVHKGRNIAFREVKAAQGKAVRAEPVNTLTDNGMLRFVGEFPELEDQLCAFTTAGYEGDRSPDRADAMVWGAYALGVVRMPGWGVYEWTRQRAEEAAAKADDATLSPACPEEPQADGAVLLEAPPNISGRYFSRSGTIFDIESGRVRAAPKEVPDLLEAGFRHPSP